MFEREETFVRRLLLLLVGGATNRCYDSYSLASVVAQISCTFEWFFSA